MNKMNDDEWAQNWAKYPQNELNMCGFEFCKDTEMCAFGTLFKKNGQCFVKFHVIVENCVSVAFID